MTPLYIWVWLGVSYPSAERASCDVLPELELFHASYRAQMFENKRFGIGSILFWTRLHGKIAPPNIFVSRERVEGSCFLECRGLFLIFFIILFYI